MNGEVYVLTKNSLPWVKDPTEILLATSDGKAAFNFEIETIQSPGRGNLKIDVWRDGEIYNTFLWSWELDCWIEQRYPETKKSQERQKEWQNSLGVDS